MAHAVHAVLNNRAGHDAAYKGRLAESERAAFRWFRAVRDRVALGGHFLDRTGGVIGPGASRRRWRYRRRTG